MPADYDELRRIFEAKAYTLTLHASERAVQRDIDDFEIEEAVISGAVIEDYPADKYGPSCLILGITKAGRLLHVQTSYRPPIRVITAYEPSSDDWESDWRTRKSND